MRRVRVSPPLHYRQPSSSLSRHVQQYGAKSLTIPVPSRTLASFRWLLLVSRLHLGNGTRREDTPLENISLHRFPARYFAFPVRLLFSI